MSNATSLLTVENKKEIAKKVGTLNKLQQALGRNPALTLDQMLINTQITPEVRAGYEKLMAQARALIAGTMQHPDMDKNELFQSLAVENAFCETELDLLLLSYALELRLNGFKPITPTIQKEAENRFVAYLEPPTVFEESVVEDVFEIREEETPDVAQSLSNNMERDVLKRELLERTRALIKLNETNRVKEMNGHKVPYPILNPYFDGEGHINIGFTDLTNNAYLLDDLRIRKDKTKILSDEEKETLLVGFEDRYEELGRPIMEPEEFAITEGFKEYSVSADNASHVADLQIGDDLDDLFQDLENTDLSRIPFALLQVALDIVYETGYALSETNPVFYNALVAGNFEGLGENDFIPRLDDMVWNNVARTKRRRALIHMAVEEWQQNNARPMGGAGKVAETVDMPVQNTGTEQQKS